MSLSPTIKTNIIHEIHSQAKIGIWHFDYELNQLEWNSVIKEIAELPADFVPTKENGFNFYREGLNRQLFEQAYQVLLETGKPFDVDLEILTAKGNIKFVRTTGSAKFKNGVCQRTYGIFEDITGRKENELELYRKNNQLNLAEKLSMIGYWNWNLRKDHLTFSDNLYRIYELPQTNHLTIEHPYGRVHPEDKEKVNKHLIKVLKTRFFDKYIHRIQLPNGKIRHLELIGKVITDENNMVVEMVGSCQDITEQKEAEYSLKASNKSLIKTTKKLKKQNLVLEDFTHITSHNLRAPVSNLNTLVGFYKEADNIEEKEVIFDKLETVTDHLNGTLNTLIDCLMIKQDYYSKRQSTNLNQILKKTLEILCVEITASQAKIFADFETIPVVKYNAIYMESIFLNLISNSLKYKSPDRAPKLRISSYLKNNKVFLKFTDNGLGIDLKKHGHKVFGLNKVFHRNPQARGVGLFMTKAQIEAMGGSIKIRSEVDKGTTFDIDLNQTRYA